MDITDIKEKINSLRKLDGGGLFKKNPFRVFGSDAHQYRFNRCLSEEQLTAFENKYSVQIPFDYRNFLKHIGNGGAGPAYGLLPLENWNIELQIESDRFLQTPFPLNAEWNDVYKGAQDGDHYETKEFMEWENEYYNEKHTTGTIRICHYGCAIYYFLVITGKEAGNIWTDDRASDNGIFPLKLNDKTRTTFAEWYQDWLTTSLQKQ